ncbi:MAG: tRNA pseudouridine(55) synthase TruB [Nitrospinota bacterium]|nr:tRNA pseudouridine(55) synthase TruB [Nitrospinota bacterium]
MNNIVNLYKPVGPSSFSMVQSVKRALNVKKAGHIGTLDPKAEGVLPICLNRSTRLIQFLVSLPKVYLATMTLGVTTDSQDATGQVTATGDASQVTEQEVRQVMTRFQGEQTQIPPMYSAKKKNGVPLYKLARKGITTERKPVILQIYALDFLKKEDNQVTFRVKCSAGTYVRTLCHDIGHALGCGAHMSELVREQVGQFDIQSSLTIEELNHAQGDGTLAQKLLGTETVLDFLPEVLVVPGYIASIVHGKPLKKGSVMATPDHFRPGTNLRISGDNGQIAAIVDPVVNEHEFQQLNPEDIAFKLKRVLI